MNRLSWRSQGRGSGAAGETMLRAHRWGHLGLILIGALVLALVGLVASGAAADPGHDGEELDPARNQPLPCEEVKTLGTPSRSARNIVHLANRCGIVGTDVEFQSREDSSGEVHDYAFLGTMGAGLRIFDVTHPRNPRPAGRYNDPGYQNDVQVEGDVATLAYDEAANASECLKRKAASTGSNGQGVDILRLKFNAETARFRVTNAGCVANAPGGAHNATLHPRDRWMAISNPSSDWAVDLVDLHAFYNGGRPKHTYRFIDESRQDDPIERATKCPEDASFECVVVKRPNGSPASELWRPHDVSFSSDGETMYVAALNSTFIVDVSRALRGDIDTISIIPNSENPDAPQTSNDIQLSHQADPSSDGKILVVADEKGGGVSNTNCNTSTGEQQVIGALHFYALAPLDGVNRSDGASPANPKKLGIYVNPNPTFRDDPLQGVLDGAGGTLPRLERGCTVHVFRLGGNGTAGPGPIQNGVFDGVSSLGTRKLVTAWYGAGTWYVNFSGGPRNDDGISEDEQTTWGNTKGWNVMPGADTWSAKEYKGHIYAGDITRGFDVFKIRN